MAKSVFKFVSANAETITIEFGHEVPEDQIQDLNNHFVNSLTEWFDCQVFTWQEWLHRLEEESKFC